MGFPIQRLRRCRKNEKIRNLVRETHLRKDDLIQPLFVVPGKGIKNEIPSMPGQYHFSLDRLVEEAAEIHNLGIPAIILFGIPESKDARGSGAWIEKGVIQRAVRKIKETTPELIIITDVCLCEYTDHGHCGVIGKNGVDNDSTLDLLAKTALSQANAGSDILAPSDMMDGRVGKIRNALDNAGMTDRLILSYAVKYASAYYGPFRDAAGSAPKFGDRKAYQMDPANGDEAMREVAADIEEGADIIMVKPGVAYLDILRRVKDTFAFPTAVYQVSGEYAMIKAAAANGWIDQESVMLETLVGFKRAGADMILTYFAKDAALRL